MTTRFLYVPLFLSAMAVSASAIPLTQSMDLLGNRAFDGWTTANLTAPSNPGFGSFPGTGVWPSAIQSGTTHATYGNGDAGLYKVKNPAGGGPYPATGSIYFGGFSGDINNEGGTLAVYDANPIANLKTVVFQVVFGEAWTYDFFNDAAPVLKVNGVTVNGGVAGSLPTGTAVDLTYRETLVREYNGTIEMPTGMEDLYNNLHAFQYDLSGFAAPITSFSLEFTGVQHSQLYALQLDQSDAFMSTTAWQPVPEPATIAALTLGVGALLRRRNKKQ